MRYVALLRAVNTGKRRIKMAFLADACSEIQGVHDVSTFIASGNVLFASRRKAATLEVSFAHDLEAALGWDVPTIIRTGAEMRAVSDAWPWPDQPDDGFIGFLKSAPDDEAIAALMSKQSDTDRFVVDGTALYWLRLDRDTKFTNNLAERHLKVVSTMRNPKTTRTLAEMLAT